MSQEKTVMLTTEYPHGPEFPILRIKTELCTAEISLYGGHILQWTPAGQLPVIFMSPKAVFTSGKALRGGMPICWPWFGKNTEDSTLPAHGIARTALWQHAGTEELEDGTLRIILALPPTQELMPSAALIIELGNELLVSLMTMDVQRTMPFSAAMHTYFAVSDYETVAITGLEECAYTEYAADAIPHCEDPLIPAGPIDRIYHPVPEEQLITIHDPAWERSINIYRAGSQSAVVWNPGQKLAAGMADLGAEAARGFLAVETTAVPAENLVLRCGETHRLTTRIEVVSIR